MRYQAALRPEPGYFTGSAWVSLEARLRHVLQRARSPLPSKMKRSC
ncbi:hypothetical protein THIARS_70502 [Thiomonas delicata]|uniref:Uncharacterized protein n=1 Tax=Thiomonas delicata TaxID=364030 RepID=A0A238D6T2_THIDL|nr:hypothetical protein THIARS_70502 [Thiomonas delicata]